MNNEIVLKDKFVDYAGKEHQFIIAATKVALKNTDAGSPLVMKIVNGIGEALGCVQVGLQIGVSICNPVDEFSEKVGTLKAIARAKNSDIAFYAAHPGQMSDNLIRTYLAQEAEYIKENPEKYIKGYNDAKARFLKHQEMEKVKENFTDIEKVIVEGVKKDPTYLDNVQKYLDYLNKQTKKCGKQRK
jgi:hypothetical protein